MMKCFEKIHSSCIYRLFVLWMVYYPLTAILFAAIWAGPIALAESTTYKRAFYYELMLFTGSIIPLSGDDWSPDHGAVSFAIINLLAVAHQLILAMFIGISAGPMLEELFSLGANHPHLNLIDPEGTLLVPRTKIGLLIKMIIYYLFIVALSVFWAAYWGAMMSLAEGWTFMDGFVTSLGVITSGLTVLQPDKYPITGWGRFCGFYVGVMGACMLGLTIAVASVPLLGIDLSYEDSPAVRIFPQLFLSKEQREKLGIHSIGCCPFGCFSSSLELTRPSPTELGGGGVATTTTTPSKQQDQDNRTKKNKDWLGLEDEIYVHQSADPSTCATSGDLFDDEESGLINLVDC